MSTSPKSSQGPDKKQTEKIAKLLSEYGAQINAITAKMESDHLVQPAIEALESASTGFVAALKVSIHPSTSASAQAASQTS